MSTTKVTRLLSVSLLFSYLLSSCAALDLLPAIPQSLPSLPTASAGDPSPEYCSPLPNAQYVSRAATIVVRYGPRLSVPLASALKFTVRGSKSGLHTGQTVLADDERTVVFKPKDAFTPGETVSVNVSRLVMDAEVSYPPLAYRFSVAINQQPGTPGSSSLAAPPIPAKPPRSAFPNFLTVPQDIPHFIMTKPSPVAGEGYIFVAPFYWTESTVGSYLLILNQAGQLVYYRSAADALDAWDFKEQPGGRLSYYNQKDSTIYVMDSHYEIVDSYQAGNGYWADLHDFQILPNGNALLLAYDAETVDMSRVVWGGNRDATVTGLVIQELDRSKNIIFEWRSWDHFAFNDSTANLRDQKIDLVHGNALALTPDGNLLLSSRNLNEITKIDLKTGNIIWRLGGKRNMFEFVGGEPFAYQHDVRQLPNGNITLFDNHATTDAPAASRAVEYRLDEMQKTATEVWQYTPTKQVFATYMGSAQRLPDGNTFLSWGAPYTKHGYVYDSMTEVTPDNRILFDFTFDQPYVSYRASLLPWQGSPHTRPALAYKIGGDWITLGYSWNGATDVAAYRVYRGSTAQALDPVDEKLKTDFETQSYVRNQPAGGCYLQVAALDKDGHELARSKIISIDNWHCPPVP